MIDWKKIPRRHCDEQVDTVNKCIVIDWPFNPATDRRPFDIAWMIFNELKDRKMPDGTIRIRMEEGVSGMLLNIVCIGEDGECTHKSAYINDDDKLTFM